jgi:hypothetical protein
MLDDLVNAMVSSRMTKDNTGQQESYSLRLDHCALTIAPVIERKRLKTVRAKIEFRWLGVFSGTGPNPPPFKLSYSLPDGPGKLTPAVYVDRAVSTARDIDDELKSTAQKIDTFIHLRMDLGIAP